MCIRDRRQHSAIIDMQKGIVVLTSEKGVWSANIINCNPTPIAINRNNEVKSYYCQTYKPSITIEDEEGEGELWKRKVEEIRRFQRERPQQEITGEQAEKLIAILPRIPSRFLKYTREGQRLSLIHI